MNWQQLRGNQSFDIQESGVKVSQEHLRQVLLLESNHNLPVITWRITDITRGDFRWFKHNNYPHLAVELILAGTLEYLNNGKRFLAPPGTLYLIAPGSMVKFAKSGKPPRRKLTLIIKGKALSPILESLHLDEDHLIPLQNPASVEQMMRNIGDLLKKKGAEAENSYLTYKLLLHLSEECTTISLYPKLLQQTLSFFENNFAGKFLLSQVASQLHTSLATLNRLFHRHLNCSPYDYLLRYRLHKAERMLFSKDLPIKVIADLCGFGSPSQFIAAFRKHYKITPGSYRENMKE